MRGRYVLINNVPVLVQASQPAVLLPPPAPAYQGFNVVSTQAAQAALSQATHLPPPQQYQDTLTKMQTPAYVENFKTREITGGMLIGGLMAVFARNEIPLGLMSKLTALQGAILHFKIDDSGSMNEASNLHLRDACAYTRQRLVGNKDVLTRWEEAEDRIHTLVELLAYVPTGPIILSFFDRDGAAGYRIELDRRGKMPEEFLKEAHEKIRGMFSREPSGGTPIFANMSNMIAEANSNYGRTECKTMHYILTDGEPSDGKREIAAIKDLLKRRNAAVNAFTFLGCSNQRQDYAWMHEMEEIAENVAAIPDFRDALKDVKENQGCMFTYTRGFWLLCNILAAVNQDDLGALNKHTPLTKPALEQLYGVGIMETEYRAYFDHHPRGTNLFGRSYSEFLETPCFHEIPVVKVFLNQLEGELDEDVDHHDDDSEAQVLLCAEREVRRYYGEDDCCRCALL